MRILAFNYEYPPLGGGGGVVFQAMYDELAKRHDVTIVTSGHGELPRIETRYGQEIHRVPVFGRDKLATASFRSMLSYVPASWRCGKRLLTEDRFDLINTHFAVPTGPAPQDLSERFGVPNVLSLHGGDIYDPSKRMSPHRLPLVRAVVRRLIARASRVVAQSSDTRNNARTFYGAQRDIDVIPLGIKAPHVPPRDRSCLGVGPERFVLVTVGRIVARKGLEALLEVMRRLDDPHDLLVVVGRGPLLPELQARARALGVADRVRFTGRVSEEDKWRLLVASDLYVSTALHEGFGLVFLEGMLAGLPVVCHDCGGQTDFLEDGRTGALVPLHDLDSFAAAIRRLKSDAALRAQCGEFNRGRATEYSIEKCAARYETLFDEVVTGYGRDR
ncbi:MAG: glycosyltransferase family 4 protein [bacterium]